MLATIYLPPNTKLKLKVKVKVKLKGNGNGNGIVKDYFLDG